MLTLRAGLGSRAPQTRRAVAQRLDTSPRSVARTERRGLRELRESARAGRCGTAAVLASTGPASPGGRPPVPDATAKHVDTRGDAHVAGDAGVADEFRTSGPPEQPDAVTPPAGADDAGDGPPALLLVALAFLAGFAAVWALDRRQHRGHAI